MTETATDKVPDPSALLAEMENLKTKLSSAQQKNYDQGRTLEQTEAKLHYLLEHYRHPHPVALLFLGYLVVNLTTVLAAWVQVTYRWAWNAGAVLYGSAVVLGLAFALWAGVSANARDS